MIFQLNYSKALTLDWGMWGQADLGLPQLFSFVMRLPIWRAIQ